MRRTTTLKAIAGLAATSLLLAACGGGGDGGSETTAAGGGDGGGEASGGKAMRLALNQTEEHPSYIALDNWGTALDEATGGNWSIDVFPNETLGAQAEALQLVSDGSVDMAVVSSPQLENLNPDFKAFEMPGVFDNIDEQLAALNDPEINSELFASLEASQKITVLGVFTQGQRSVYTSFGEVQTPADLAGKKIRVQETDKWVAIATALGGSATPMAFGELYTGLQAGVVDAAENNEVSYWTQKHYEVAPYYSYTSHIIGADYVIINTDVLNSMSEEDKATFLEGFAAASAEHAGLWEASTQDAIDQATAGGATFYEIDNTPFKDALAAIVPDLLDNENQQALYDALVAAAE